MTNMECRLRTWKHGEIAFKKCGRLFGEILMKLWDKSILILVIWRVWNQNGAWDNI